MKRSGKFWLLFDTKPQAIFELNIHCVDSSGSARQLEDVVKRIAGVSKVTTDRNHISVNFLKGYEVNAKFNFQARKVGKEQ